jgi:hypothetical protein
MPGAVVGEIFRKRAIRAPINPMDRSTIISVYPREIDETKVTLSPSRWIIPAGSPDKPSLTIIGPSSWWREIDEEQPLLEIPVSSILIAESIVRDWMNGLVGCDMSNAMPGIFYVPGEFTLPEVASKYGKAIQNAIVRQKNWYDVLLKLGDALWARSRGNPMVITDDMRLAARETGATKDWMQSFQAQGMVRCKACGTLKNPDYPVCPNCHAIDDPEKAAKLGIKFAS